MSVALWQAAVPEHALPGSPAGPVQTGTAAGDDRADTEGEAFGDIETDEAWALVRTIADDLALDDINAAGIGMRHGSADGMVLGMSDQERSALAQLLDEAIRERPSSESPS